MPFCTIGKGAETVLRSLQSCRSMEQPLHYPSRLCMYIHTYKCTISHIIYQYTRVHTYILNIHIYRLYTYTYTYVYIYYICIWYIHMLLSDRRHCKDEKEKSKSEGTKKARGEWSWFAPKNHRAKPTNGIQWDWIRKNASIFEIIRTQRHRQ